MPRCPAHTLHGFLKINILLAVICYLSWTDSSLRWCLLFWNPWLMTGFNSEVQRCCFFPGEVWKPVLVQCLAQTCIQSSEPLLNWTHSEATEGEVEDFTCTFEHQVRLLRSLVWVYNHQLIMVVVRELTSNTTNFKKIISKNNLSKWSV